VLNYQYGQGKVHFIIGVNFQNQVDDKNFFLYNDKDCLRISLFVRKVISFPPAIVVGFHNCLKAQANGQVL
jgi:hypothetical protein